MLARARAEQGDDDSTAKGRGAHRGKYTAWGNHHNGTSRLDFTVSALSNPCAQPFSHFAPSRPAPPAPIHRIGEHRTRARLEEPSRPTHSILRKPVQPAPPL